MNIDRLFRFSGMDSSLEDPKFFADLKKDLENIIDLLATLPEPDASKNHVLHLHSLDELAADEPFENEQLHIIRAKKDDILKNTQEIKNDMIKI